MFPVAAETGPDAPLNKAAQTLYDALKTGVPNLAALQRLAQLVADRLAVPPTAEIGVLTELALTDSLTGALNRRGFDQVLAESVALGHSFGLLLADIDGLKALNAAYGLRGGDQALVAAAQAIGKALRTPDRLARIGGDEFALLLPRVRTCADLERIANRVAAAVPHQVDHRGQKIPVSLCIGGALARDPAGLPEAFDRADLALRCGKADGPGTVRIIAKGPSV